MLCALYHLTLSFPIGPLTKFNRSTLNISQMFTKCVDAKGIEVAGRNVAKCIFHS